MENKRDSEVSTITKEIYWTAYSCDNPYEEKGATILLCSLKSREEAEKAGLAEGLGFVAREISLFDEATEAGDVIQADVYRVNGPLVCTRHWEPDLRPPDPRKVEKFLSDVIKPAIERRKAQAKKADSMAEWKARQLSATPKPGLYVN